MKFLDSISKFLPFVLGGVISVQQTVDASVPGATKKQLVLNSLLAAVHIGEQVPNAYVAGISALIDLTVSTLKAANVHGFVEDATTTVAANPTSATVKT